MLLQLVAQELLIRVMQAVTILLVLTMAVAAVVVQAQ
jgi:hypothetical protein